MSIARSPLADGTRGTQVRGSARAWVIIAIALVGAAVGAMAAIVVSNLRTQPAEPLPPLRLSLHPPADVTMGGGSDYPFGLSLAPDGRRLVFPGVQDGQVQLWLHDLTTGGSHVLPGTDSGVLPFWAPDGRAIAFFAGGRLRVFVLQTGTVEDLASAPSPGGGVWHPGGDIIFGPEADGPLVRRRGSDGRVEPFTALDDGESGHRHPALLDAGRHIVFFVRSSESMRQGLWIAALATPAERRRLTATDAHGVVLGDAVVYASGTALVAQSVNVEARAVRGRPILLGTAVGRSSHHRLFATSGGDVLIYGGPASTLRELRWFDRAGTSDGIVGEPMDAWDVRVAPRGERVAVTRPDPQLDTLDVWTYDGRRPLPRRISPSIDADESPAWSRDATRLAWVSGRRTVTVRDALADLPDAIVARFDHPVRVTSWSPDGQWLVVSEARPATGNDLWLVAPDGRTQPRAYAQSPFNDVQGAVSPDGRWMAYVSDESGRFELYLDSFPTPGTRGRLTLGGAVEPRWRADGGELYFRRGSEIHVVTPAVADGLPIAASSHRLFDAGVDVRSYDVTPDGQRLLLNVPAPGTAPQQLTAIVNAATLLRVSREAESERR
jgi:eukaryotic-like serine/threonine-protein kinase